MTPFGNGDAASTDEKSPWVQPGFIAAAAVVALLVLLGLILSVTGGSNGHAPNGAADPAAGTPPAATGQDAGASVCGLAAGDQTIPRAAPTARWRLRGTLAVPSAPATFGPRSFKARVPSCFAHSPTGALFANISIYAALSEFAKRPPADPRVVLRQLIASGPGRDAAERRAGKGSRAPSDASAGVQVAGFSVVRYEPGSAVVDLAFRVDRPGVAGYFHTTSTMRWERGDWRLVLAQDGVPFDSTQAIASLGGYVPWSGV